MKYRRLQRYSWPIDIYNVNYHFAFLQVGIWVDGGSRYENENNNGVAHFLEHMVFKVWRQEEGFILDNECILRGQRRDRSTNWSLKLRILEPI